MSKSNASAKSRRAFIDTSKQNQFNPSIPSSSPSPSQPSTGLTLQQVISVIDKRLINVETFVKEYNENSDKKVSFREDNVTNDENNDDINDIISEYNSRFTLLAEEISNIKDILLKLQTYTMTINKTLMEERIHSLSDLGTLVTDPTSDINNMIIENITTSTNSNDITNDSKDNDINDSAVETNDIISDSNIDKTYAFSNNFENNTSNVKNENSNNKINTGTNFRRNRNTEIKLIN